MPDVTTPDPRRVRAVLSAPRFDKYVQAAGGDQQRAVELYGWNARMSAALLLPAHFAEITIRNVVHDALSEVYGPNWPGNPTFRGSLPSPQRDYKPRKDLEAVTARQPTTGKVIAEMRFVFWQMMFTASHHQRVWSGRIVRLLPQATLSIPGAATAGVVPSQGEEKSLRQRVYDDLDAIRAVRNRMAHHEPIHTRDLADDLRRMLELVDLRSTSTGRWVRGMEDASAILAQKP